MKADPEFAEASLGFGVGLRNCHFKEVLGLEPGASTSVDWFEIISENFMDGGGRHHYVLDQVAERFPVVMHGVSLSIGSTDPFDPEYLRKLKKLADQTGTPWVSDHLCWTGLGGHNSHDLLPLPYNEESLTHVIKRIQEVQETLERPLVLENPSRYVAFASDDLGEAEFLAGLVSETGCRLLVDVNNTYVSSVNLGFDPNEWLDTIPMAAIVQIHLAGPARSGQGLVDTHDHPVPEPVWKMFERVWNETGGCSTLLEWDSEIPSFPELLAELDEARATARGLPRSRSPYDPMGEAFGDSTPALEAQVSAPIHHLLEKV